MSQPKDTSEPKRRTPSTRSVEYFCVIAVSGPHIPIPKLEQLATHIFGDLTNFAYFPLRKTNSYFVYARREKKKRIYDHTLTGEFEKWAFSCRIVNLKDSIVSTMY